MNLPVCRQLPVLALILLATGGPAAENIVATRFAARSGPGGATRFTVMSPDHTGIVMTNAYDDPRMWAERHREYHVGAIGSGVAVGDFDGDGKPDLFILSKLESGRLYRNRGDFRFDDVTDAAGLRDDRGEWKQGAAFADVNNDGRLDLHVCYFGVPNRLYINQGDGTFKEEAAARGLALTDASNMAAFCDYDRDGWLDVYIQTNLRDGTLHPAGQRDHLFRNNGDGTFRDVSDAAGILTQGTQGHSATWWDVDEDGWPDLYVANDFEIPDFLYRNNRDGTFTNVIDRTVPHMPFSAMGSDLGDVDNDGHLDFFVADMAGTTREKTQRGLADSRARIDATQNERAGTAVQLLRNMLYLNTGTGRCMEAAYLAGLAGTNWTWSVRFEDLDNDGRLDLFVTNGMDREQNNLDMIERRLAAVSPLERVRITQSSPVLREANLAYANRGDLRFEEVGREWGLDQVGVSFGAAFGDLDGDGDLDLVYTNFQAGPVVLRNDSQSGNSLVVALHGTASNRFGAGARVEAVTRSGRQVRQLVLARGYTSTSEPVVHFGCGGETTVERLTVTWPNGRVQMFGGLAIGQRYDITEPAAAPVPPPTPAPATQFTEVSGALGLDFTQRKERLEGTVTQPLLPRRFNRRGPGLAVNDLDGDGVDEIVLAATVLDGVRVLGRAGAAGGYRPRATGALGKPPPLAGGPPLVFDANGDGASDLLLTAGGAALPAEEPEYEPALWLNDRRGGFTLAPGGTLPSLPISVGAAVAADFNRDGALDVFLGGRLLPGYYPEAATSALLLQRSGRLAERTAAFAPSLREIGLVTSAVASDVDGDGWIDLVVALDWGGVRGFRNQGGRGLTDASAAWGFDLAGTGRWTSVATADFNHDGKPDFAVGNLGLNTAYTATRDHPLRLFAGDFAGDGKVQLVEAVEEAGRLLPVASRSELAARIPLVLRRFASNNRYAAATLEEILGPAALAKATVYTAGELRSGVFLSEPGGTYRFNPLPRTAQIAPVQGMAAADFDGDGHQDLLLATNDYSPVPAVGRFDGGLGWLLRGDGRGGFAVVPADRSGWVVPGNAKALAVADLDGDARPDAVVTRNNESTLAFRNVRSGGRRHVAVRLHGRGGNPSAIGTRVTLASGGRDVQSIEITAGGGWASQSTATAFFSVPAETTDGKLRIRWPSGAVTETALPARGGYLTVRE